MPEQYKNDEFKKKFKPKEYKNMIDLAKEIVKQFYNKITGKILDEKENPDIIKFLVDESEKYKKLDDLNSKQQLESIAEALKFIENFENKIFNIQNSKKYKFNLDDFYSLLDEKNRLRNCANIFKKEKESKELDKDKILFPPSFIFYLNNNQKFVDELFNYVNNSDNSIIKDLTREKKEDINYLPFWLFILRNISSLNCLQYNREDIDSNITANIISRIKYKLSECLKNKKPLNFKWLNLLLENISFEVFDPIIHYFYYFFNSLLKNLNIPEENLNDFAKKEIEKYIFEVIDSLFDDNINMTLNQDIYKDENNLVLKFTKNPSLYLTEKLIEYIDDKFKENKIINKKNIEEIINTFLIDLEENSSNLVSKIKKKNEELIQNELTKQKNNTIKKNVDILKGLISKCLNIKNEENFIFLQISKEESDLFENFIKSEKLDKNGKDEDKYKLYIISYKFNVKNFKDYTLSYKKKKIEIAGESGEIYLITNEDLKKLNIKPFSINAIILNYEKPYEFFISNLAKTSIENYVNKKVRLPIEKEDLINPPEILFFDKNLSQFCKEIERVKQASKNLSELFKNMIAEKKKNKDTIYKFEKEIEELLSQLKAIKDILILKPNDFKDLIELSKKLENVIFEYYSILNNYYDNYKNSMKEKLKLFSSEETKIFNIDFSLPKLPKKINKSGITFLNMDKKSKNLSVPIINLDSEGKNLICCYKSLDINLGLICPALYSKENNHYTINIISFVNEDLKVKIDDYKLENKIIIKKKENKEDKEKEEDNNKDDEDKNEQDRESTLFDDELENKEQKYLFVPEELIKKGENIKLFVEIPQIFNNENTIEIRSKLNIETISGKKLNLPINLTLCTIPISVLLSCKEYNLKKDKEEIKYENNYKIKKYFILDAYELTEGEIINFELLNYKEKDIEFYINAESLEKNTSVIPTFIKEKQKNNFQITIPKYDLSSKNEKKEIRLLNCMLEIFINDNFIIYIKIDSLIKPNLAVFKMYDFYSKKLVENELKIHLNEITQRMFKRVGQEIKLHCLIYSNFEKIKFSIKPDQFEGGFIEPYEGMIEDNKCRFTLKLKFNDLYNDTIKN